MDDNRLFVESSEQDAVHRVQTAYLSLLTQYYFGGGECYVYHGSQFLET